MTTPRMPFDGFKWKWASLAPTEGLNTMPVFLGVLRALNACEGQLKSSQAFYEELMGVERAINNPRIHLARDRNRNLMRNSGQYWSGLGVIEPTRGVIQLTQIGRRLASGQISRDEFTTHLIENFELPNLLIMRRDEVELWRRHNVSIKPLKLIVEILRHLESTNPSESAISVMELRKVIIPLSAVSTDAARHAEKLLEYRRSPHAFDGWPDVATEDNDMRFFREFLLFLYNFGVLEKLTADDAHRDAERYRISDSFNDSRNPLVALDVERSPAARSRRLSSAWYRDPGFSTRVMRSHPRCIITGESLPRVLEAAHIIPVGENGSDDASNGICLRCDIHRLFDSGDIKINRCGELLLSGRTTAASSYGHLLERIVIPAYVNRDFIDWRWRFL